MDIFKYCDTNSARAGIADITDKFSRYKVGIIGLGGTGSYILDLISKTSVKEIHLYDADKFKNHNAFRAPGAPNIDILCKELSKVEYFEAIYKNMHDGIIAHDTFITEETVDLLLDLDFVFICMDSGKNKKIIIDKLLSNSISFIDTGIGIQRSEDKLIGSARITMSINGKKDHINNSISFAETDENEDIYSTNIQIAEMNAMCAVMAVIRWKESCGFYKQYSTEVFSSVYNIFDGEMCNDSE